VNATGVWADRISPDEFYDSEDVPHIRPSRGTHVTIAHDKLPLNGGGAIAPAGKGRTIFVLPWLGRTLIGTTDVDYEGGLDHIPPSEDDIDYLLGAANAFFGTELGPADLTGAYAGVRPLIATGDPKKSVDISRRAELYETSSGMLTITGGKLTTFRRMAKQVVDRIVERDGRDAPCRTHEIPLGMSTTVEELRAVDGIDDATRALLVHRYGYFANEVLGMAEAAPELRERIVPDLPDLMAEVVVAVRREQALSLGDVFLRRTRLGLLAAPVVSNGEVPRKVARVLGAELGWDDAGIARELARWQDESAAEGIALSGVAAG
jgi:glycerol-3-phosphate dehydrogenase